MGLKHIADRLDAVLYEASEHVAERRAQIVESDTRKMAHHIMAYALESAPVGTDPYELGQALVQGSVVGEDESGGELTTPVIEFLESMLAGAKAVVTERYGGEHLTLDPVQHAVQYYLAHGKWPEAATPGVISKARTAIASGKGGGSGNKAVHGTFL